jgi:hypothetical protein
MSVAVPAAGQGRSRVLDVGEHRPSFGGDAASPTAPTMAQDQAVIGWLATRPALPDLTRDLLIDVLIFWQSLAPLPAVTAEPHGGPVVDLSEQLRAVARRVWPTPATLTITRPRWSWPIFGACSAWRGTPCSTLAEPVMASVAGSSTSTA